MTFWFETLKQDYIEELTLTCDIFCKELLPIAKSKWNKEENILWQRFKDYHMRSEMLTQYIHNDESQDLPEDFVFPEEYQLDWLLQEWHMKYNSYLRITGMALSNIVMMWEQQLYEQMKYFDVKTNNHYKDISNFCSEYTDYDLVQDKKIKEIRHLVNAIKHGKDTKSYRWLERQNSKYLKPEVASQFSELEERYLYIELSIHDIQLITDYLIGFWKIFKFNETCIK